MCPRSKPAFSEFDLGTLRNWALRYLARYDATAEQLRRYLSRKIQNISRRTQADQEYLFDRAGAAQKVETVIDGLKRLDLIDDEKFLAGRLATLKRKGFSRAKMKMDLASKGIKDIDPAIFAAIDSEAQARIFAARKKLGPFRCGEGKRSREAMHEKDIATLVRNGFSYAIAKAVVEAKEQNGR